MDESHSEKRVIDPADPAEHPWRPAKGEIAILTYGSQTVTARIEDTRGNWQYVLVRLDRVLNINGDPQRLLELVRDEEGGRDSWIELTTTSKVRMRRAANQQPTNTNKGGYWK